MRLKNFPGISYSAPPGQPIRIYWREHGRQFGRSFHTWTAAMTFVESIYGPLAAQRVQASKVVQLVVPLAAELDWYKGRLARERQQGDSQHGVNALGAIRRILKIGAYTVPLEVTPESFDQMISNRKEHLGGFMSDLAVFQTFIRRLHEKGVVINPMILVYRVNKPTKKRIHFPWSPEEITGWWSYLSRGMEALADCDLVWSWHERIRQRCLTYEFAQRMRLIPLYLAQSRYLFRPSESRRLQAGNWDNRRRVLTLEPEHAKREPKICLADDEAAWLFEVCAKGGVRERPLFQSPDGVKWNEVAHQALWRHHLDAAGLADKKPYDVKYTTATYIFENPEEFKESNLEERINRVRAITGHTPHSKSTEDYIQSLWGSPYHLQVRDFYNKRRIFPFRIEDFPACAASATQPRSAS